MTEQDGLSWDDDTIDIDEEVSEEDIKEAESMGKVAVGRYFCECVGSEPRQKDFANYSCIAANLRWEIQKVLELNGVAVQGDEGEAYEGRAIFDDVALYSGMEKDGMRKRRILVAKRVGLISGSDDKITKEMWKTGIIGKKAIINYIEEEYMPKDGTVMKKSRKVAFDGYESADGMEITDQTPDIDAI
jgi:hypothetical protein